MNLAKVVHIDLTEAGFEGSWVDVRNPRVLAYGRLVETGERYRRAQTAATSTDPDERARAVSESVQLFLEQIVDWKIIDPETGEPIGAPSPETVNRLPLAALAAITDQLDALYLAAVPSALRNRAPQPLS